MLVLDRASVLNHFLHTLHMSVLIPLGLGLHFQCSILSEHFQYIMWMSKKFETQFVFLNVYSSYNIHKCLQTFWTRKDEIFVYFMTAAFQKVHFMHYVFIPTGQREIFDKINILCKQCWARFQISWENVFGFYCSSWVDILMHLWRWICFIHDPAELADPNRGILLKHQIRL